jgi:molybdate transport system ATP-binding protein
MTDATRAPEGACLPNPQRAPRVAAQDASAPAPCRLQVALQCSGPVPLRAEIDCAAGELVALVGASGSGKTTLLRAIAGLYQPPGLQGRVCLGREGAGGQAPGGEANPRAAAPEAVWFDSQRGIALPAQDRRVGLVFQQYALFPHLSAIQNIAAYAYAHWPADQKQAQSMALLARLGLADLAQRLPHQLSGGQQQRVALARALMRILPLPQTDQPPGVLLLDEPFSAVDAPMRQVLYRELAQLHASLQVPMILVTHDLAEARRLADRVVIVDAGTTLQSGPPEWVLRSPRNARVAELVGIHNHFAGQFYCTPAPSPNAPAPVAGLGQLHWGSQVLQVPDKGKIANDTAVTWVMAGDMLNVLPADAVPVGHAANATTADNYLPCQLVEMLPLGEISVCKLAVPGTATPARPQGDVVTLNLSTALLRGMSASQGAALTLHLPPQALHIMPLR